MILDRLDKLGAREKAGLAIAGGFILFLLLSSTPLGYRL